MLGPVVRSQALPADARRAMLIRATLPLLVEHGPKVTTRQIAEAAGVAEGTIFRVFPDKESLIQAALGEALDPEQTLAELRAVDMRLPLRIRTLQVSTIMQVRLIRVFSLLLAFRTHASGAQFEPHRQAAKGANDLVIAEVVRILEPDADQLRWPVIEVARVLRLLVFSGSHPLITDGDLLRADEITEVILDGLLERDKPRRPPRGGAHTDGG
jgi:AcrR family transcriptional regulator